MSRLVALPGVPWEQDEALFAASAFDTNVVEHRPHPPGFPLWIAAAKVSLWVSGNPLLGLQLISALASVATVWLLVLLWRKPLGDLAALLGGGLYAALPGVWFHAPRAFSTTPALAAAAAAAWCWTRPGGRRFALGVLWAAAAVLVRPILAPPVGLLGVAALWLRRERPLRWGLAAVSGVTVVAAGFVPLVADTGGIRPFLVACRTHLLGHAGALHLAPWTITSLGVVKAAGGIGAFGGLVLLAAVGLARATTDARHRLAWVVLTACTAGWILAAHNRTYPRYTLPILALLAFPAIAGVLSLLGRRLGSVAAVGLIALVGVAALPAVIAQAKQPFPVLSCFEEAAESGARTVVVDPDVSPFGDLLNLAHRGPGRTVSRPLVTEGRIRADRLSGPLAAVWAEPDQQFWVPPPLHHPTQCSCSSVPLRYLAQDRYLTAHLGLGGAVVLSHQPFDPAGGGVRVNPRIELLMATPLHGGRLGMVFTARGPVSASLWMNGRRLGARVIGPGTTCQTLPVPPGISVPGRLVRLVLEANDRLMIREAWMEDALEGVGEFLISPSELSPSSRGMVESTGLFGVETFAEERPGRWTGRKASVTLPLAVGTLRVRLIAPRPAPAQVFLEIPPSPPQRFEVGSSWQTVDLSVPENHRRTLLVRVANPFVPHEETPSSPDTRELGVVVGDLQILTSPRP